MASNMFNSKGSSAVVKQHKPEPFSEVVSKFGSKLPLAVEVTGGGRYSGTKDAENANVQVHKGDIIWVTKANVQSITVSIESSKKKEHPVILPSDWSGKFTLPTQDEYPKGHVFTTIAELAKDFPIFVTVRQEFEIDNVVVKLDSRLKLLRHTTSSSEGKSGLVCSVVGTNDDITIPEDLEGKFEKTEADVSFDVKDLTERLPLHVLAVTGSGEESEADTQSIPGIPDDYDGTLLLSSVSYSEAVLWETSNQAGVGILKIPSETKMEVIPLETWEEDKGPPKDVMELAKAAQKDKPVYATPTEGSEDILDELGIAHDATLILHPVEQVERILVQGCKSPLLVNKQYRGYFKPQTEYGTGQDLVNFGIHREVRVTQPYQPKEEEVGLAPLFVNDVVKLHLSKAKMFSTDEDTEVLVVELERTASKCGASLGVIYVPASALVGFQERSQYSVDQKLALLSHTSQVPLSASFSNGPVNKSSDPADNTRTDEEILREESPIMIQGTYKYPVVLATVLNKETPNDSKVIEISEHRHLKVHRVRRPPETSLPERTHQERSGEAVIKISQKYFDSINQDLQQMIATKNVKRRKKRGGDKENDSRRKTWVQRHLSLKAIQKRLTRSQSADNADMAEETVQTTEEWTI